MFSVDYLVLADAAVAVEGKHYILGGGWDTLFAASVPVQHSSLGIALRLRATWNDTNEAHRIALDIMNADGVSVLDKPVEGTVTVGRPPTVTSGSDQTMALAFTLTGLQLSTYGVYEVVVKIDGLDRARSPFAVAPPPSMPMPRR